MPALGVQSCFLCKAGLEHQRPWASRLAFVSKFCLSTFSSLSRRGGEAFPQLKGFGRIVKITRASDNTSKPNESNKNYKGLRQHLKAKRS